jgi:hypothetical protein
VVRTGPDVDEDQGPEVNDGEAVREDGAIGHKKVNIFITGVLIGYIHFLLIQSVKKKELMPELPTSWCGIR